ncbi:homogentisate phytyltransferase [Oscillochloris sp. ZM17-4]|uniref:homogentisate phytyltransferase n=1 Tax=Oscillochloris sp. ZM17-4 TaxID=2866714 RepID=UPI001C73947A|nr:homogentisate phytyltransferase [Oscillochloris sp. ZM17-4]MBX0328972.1 homogentisate phytyltransferase [Oscillochloris sp. ZM17-4]
MRMLRTLVAFGRPHTIIATTVQVLTIFVIVAGRQAGPAAVAPLTLALVACLSLNVYVVGINQITDVDIDRVNKPWLPLAGGRLSMAQGRVIVAAAGVLALTLALIAGPYLLLTVAPIMLIGTLYSLPPARLKRRPISAAISIAFARGVLSNLGLALHYSQVFGVRPPLITLAMMGVFFFGFGLVIAIYKDLPDGKGDALYKIETFTTSMGPQRVLGLGRAILSICYGIPILLALLLLPSGGALFLLLSHLAIIGLFWLASLRVDLRSQTSISGFYMFLWAIFYAEFGVLSLYELTRAIG